MADLKPSQRILCALDTIVTSEACNLAATVGPHVGGIKLGLEFFGANGPQGFKEVSKASNNIFLDLKLHDIPNTVAKAIHALMPLKPTIMTIHTAGGPAMMAAAANAATEAAKNVGCARPIIVGVTILTSLDDQDLDAVGYQNPVSEQVIQMAKLAKESGLDGVVCSPHEISLIKEACGKEFKLVVPGIRPAGSSTGDQKRVMTPDQAVKLGADYLVIGRPITQSDDPIAAVKAITKEIDA
ncbi:MAG: orotidine-5'-phosphate decarboxylase [Kordiimonadaceae bacterium]|jgi:orotidine-5'-phosphate decarboxylase|nr:orotidine-5'-phosphate decarboxylase [Kordiimonadaceae bacterium]MBT6031632.1 orotidine-5'-phosphate decarboxylase [Kordiimonadaceae bacterium]